MTLKTLKDIQIERLNLEHYKAKSFEGDIRVFTKKRIDKFLRDLKQEAIKWVKNKCPITEDTWIDFFNITEEDLQ